MRVVVISDTHGMHGRVLVPECDLLIHCGDFSRTGSYEDHYVFSKWLGEQKAKYKICVPGNHDRYSGTQSIVAKELFDAHGVTLLIDEMIEIEGKRIYCSPWTPRFGRWYWMKDRGESIARMWENIPNDLDILVTHGPPHGILDEIIWDHTRVGCEELDKAIKSRNIKHSVFGHIHHWGGTNITIGNTTYHNAAICTEQYEPLNPITEFEL